MQAPAADKKRKPPQKLSTASFPDETSQDVKHAYSDQDFLKQYPLHSRGVEDRSVDELNQILQKLNNTGDSDVVLNLLQKYQNMNETERQSLLDTLKSSGSAKKAEQSRQPSRGKPS